MRIIISLVLISNIFIIGLRAQGIQSITNGFPIEIHQVPYQVSIKNKADGKSVINNKYCVNGLNADEITINVGFSLQNAPGNNLQSYEAERIVVHPNYDNDTNDFDVALIEIDGIFTFNNFVQPIQYISNRNLAPETIRKS